MACLPEAPHPTLKLGGGGGGGPSDDGDDDDDDCEDNDDNSDGDRNWHLKLATLATGKWS